MKRTKIIVIMLISILLLSTVVSAEEITNVKISVSGKQLNIPEEFGYPFLDNQSRTMIPLRIVSESLGHEVTWNQAEQKATIDGNVHITIGEKFVETGKGKIEMDTWAILKGGRTYVPLRFVVEALGYEVTYDGPKASNGFHHMVDIKGEYKPGTGSDTGSDNNDGDVFVVKFPNGKEVTLVKGTDYNKGMTPAKSAELIEALFDTIKYTENKASGKVEMDFFMPELPEGVKWGMLAQLRNKDGQYLPIFISTDYKPGQNKGVIDDFGSYGGNWGAGPSAVELVNIRVNLQTSGTENAGLIYEPKTGRKAADTMSMQATGTYRLYLFEDNEINNVRPFYLPQYK